MLTCLCPLRWKDRVGAAANIQQFSSKVQVFHAQASTSPIRISAYGKNEADRCERLIGRSNNFLHFLERIAPSLPNFLWQ